MHLRRREAEAEKVTGQPLVIARHGLVQLVAQLGHPLLGAVARDPLEQPKLPRVRSIQHVVHMQRLAHHQPFHGARQHLPVLPHDLQAIRQLDRAAHQRLRGLVRLHGLEHERLGLHHVPARHHQSVQAPPKRLPRSVLPFFGVFHHQDNGLIRLKYTPPTWFAPYKNKGCISQK